MCDALASPLLNLRIEDTEWREEKYLGRHEQVRTERNVVFENADRVAVTQIGTDTGTRIETDTESPDVRLDDAKTDTTDLDLV